jgi:FAD/FMN-containing dehydrogenase
MAVDQVQRAAVDARLEAKSAWRLQEHIQGEIVLPGDEGYDAARQVWNRAVDRRPAMIVRPDSAADVGQAVRFARAQELPLSVRSGGHSMAGYGVVDGGVVVDLSRMKAMSVDPEQRLARAQTGLTWGEYAAQAHAYGLATTSGDAATTGLGGLTLGGGIGWMVRKHGLAIDNLRSAEVVTADGEIVTASAARHPDLFWALRGGGGNFGIATQFEFDLVPAGTVLAGAIFYPADPDIIAGHVAAASAAPDELTTIAFVMRAPPLPFIPAEKHGSLVYMLMLCYTGDLEAGQRAVAPLRALGTPIADMVGPMPYPAIYDLLAEATKPAPHSVRSAFVTGLDEDLAAAIVEHTRNATAPLALAQVRVLGGALARVPADATAFAHRDKPIMLTGIAAWDDPSEAERHVEWSNQFLRTIRPRASGVYSNFVADEGEARIREAYPPATYDRLAAIKRRYDPTNFFRSNQNIHPAA